MSCSAGRGRFHRDLVSLPAEAASSVGRPQAGLGVVEILLTVPQSLLCWAERDAGMLPLPYLHPACKAASVRVVKGFADTWLSGVRPAERSLLGAHPC